MADTLIVRLAEDAWNGDAQFTLDVDGVQIAAPTSVTTLEGSGYQEFTYTGDFGAGPHTVQVHFINDAWGGSTTTDRNLYVNGIVFDGTFYAGQTATNDGRTASEPDLDPNAAEMYRNGTVTFTDVAAGGPGGQTITGTDGPDSLVGGSGNDSIDGGGGNDTIDGAGGDDTLIGGAGQDIFIQRAGDGVTLVRDFAVGTGGDVVNLVGYGIDWEYVKSHLHQAFHVPGSDLTLPNGEMITLINPDGLAANPDNFTADNFLFDGAPSPPPSGSDTLVLHLSEDAWNGDAQFLLFVDGVQIAGPTSVTAKHGTSVQDFTYTGSFGAGPHSVDVRFVNDAWGGTPETDRNLYVGGITFDGVDYSGQTAANTGAGPDTDPNAAEVFSNGTVTFTNVTGSSGGTTNHIVGTAGPDNITGTSGRDLIDALGGNDTVHGGDGDDTINGGADNDFIYGEGGNDVIAPGPGFDNVYGGPGSDSLIVHGGEGTKFFNDFTAGSGAGHDVINLDSLPFASFADLRSYLVQDGQHWVRLPLTGHDYLYIENYGPDGISVADLTDANFTITNSVAREPGHTITGTAGADSLLGGDGADTIIGGDGNDNIDGGIGDDSLDGGAGNDTLSAWSGGDTLIGGSGDDVLIGGYGHGELLLGGDGNDNINFRASSTTADGGAGNDSFTVWSDGVGNVLTGGAGADSFTYISRGAEAAAGDVTVTDFQAGTGGEHLTFVDSYAIDTYGPYVFDAIYSHMVDQPDGSTVLHNDDGSTISFLGVGRDQFVADNFSGFTEGHPPPYPGPFSTLVLHLSEDAWNGDAKFRLLIDGHEMTGGVAVTTAHSSGGFQDFSYTGQFGTDPHTIEIQFVNDAWGGTPDTDRNLYVHGITYDGHDYAGQTAENTAFNGGPDIDPNAAEMYANGSVIFHDVLA